MDKDSLGKLGERIASQFLQKKGYQIIEINFQKRWGELDIVCTFENVLIFVEVKTRMSGSSVPPEESISNHKLASLKKTALFYKQNHPKLPEALRIDFIGIEMDSSLKPIRINHIENIVSQ